MKELTRFETKFKKGNPNECWIWKGGVDINSAGIPYGYFWISHSQKVRAHRFSYEIYKQLIPQGLQIRHKCHNSLCVNPFHLDVGTSQDNMDDKVEAGRQARGRRHGRSQRKFTEEQVKYIRACNLSNQEVANQFGVNPSSISRIRSRQNWGWLF